MALRKARRLTCEDTADVPSRVAQFTDVEVYDDRVIMAYREYTWHMKCKRAFGAHQAVLCLRASRKLGRVYFENCPLSLSQRVTANSFPHEFQSSQSCRVDAH